MPIRVAKDLKYWCLASNLIVQYRTNGPNLEYLHNNYGHDT